MSSAPVQHIVPAGVHTVPAPFRSLAVRSDEARHAWQARAPYGRVHVLHTGFLDAASRASLVAEGQARVRARGRMQAFSDIDHAPTTWRDLASAAPGVADLAGCIAQAVQTTGVLGDDLAQCRRSVANTRIDYLASCGAGFHNDVTGHWTSCLFWLLALDLADVEFVMPHAGVRIALAPGDLLVFDQTMAHGLCRPADAGQAVPASFEPGPDGLPTQLFLTGELALSDAQWAALGAPWLPVEVHEARAALDLRVAEFDERSGTIQRPRTLRDGMKRSTCHVDGLAA